MYGLSFFRQASFWLLVTCLPIACQAQDNVPASMTVTSGSSQTALLNANFSQPLVVTVLNQEGNPLSNQTVTFSGSGIASASAVTGANGQASAIVTANSMLGGYTVSANVSYFVRNLGGPANNVGTLISVTTVLALNNADQVCQPSISVTNSGDAGSGTLRQSLADVCAGGTVDLSGLTTPATITLQNRLYLNRNVRILGPLAGTVTISGNHATRLFFMQDGYVTMANLTLANGYGQGGNASSTGGGGGAGMGGAIFQNGGTLTLTKVTFNGNQAAGGTAALPAAQNCPGSFAENAPDDSSQLTCAGDLGGAGSTTSFETFFGVSGLSGGDGEAGQDGLGNLAGGNGGFGGGGGGGAGYGAGAGGGFGGGGAISAEGGVVGLGGFGGGNAFSYLAVPELGFYAHITGAGAGFGGAIFERRGTLNLTGVTFTGNSAVAGASGAYNPNGAQAKGGALFVYYGASANLADVSFIDNTAPDAGKPSLGSSAIPYIAGATCPGTDDSNVCGQAPSISANAGSAVQIVPAGAAFTPLSVTLSDGSGNPLSGVTVTFSAPATGASGQFSNSRNTIAVQTDASGTATVPFSANNISGGPYLVTATAEGVTQGFYLTNFSAATSFPLIIAQSPGAVRSDDATVGFQFTVGPRPVTVYALGRWQAPGDSSLHAVRIVQANGIDLPNGSATISTAGATPGTYQYAPLASPVLLLANTSYFLVSQEGSDPWYDYGTVTSAAFATVVAPVYIDGHGNYFSVNSLPGQAYVPLNLLAAPPANGISASISSPSPNSTLSGVSSVTVATTGPVTALQLQIDGVNQGSALPVPVSQSPYTLSLDTTLLTPGAHTLTVTASDPVSNSSVSSPVSINVSNPGGATAAFVVGEGLGRIRNDYTGFVGLSLQVGSTPVVVTSLGRYTAPGNSGTHLLKLVNSDGTGTSGGSVTVSTAGASAGAFQYAALAAPVTLLPNTSYFLVSQETAMQDRWYDYGPVTTSAALDASVAGPAYTDGHGNYVVASVLSGNSYVPVNFLYSAPGVTLSAAITAPQSGTLVSGGNVAVSVATSGSFTSLQLQIDGVITGTPVSANPLSFDSTRLTNGFHALAVLIAGGSTTTISPTVVVQVSNPNPPAPFTTGQTAGMLRNDYSGFVGMAIQVGATPVSISSLGRLVASGNNGTHTLKLVQADGSDVPGGAVTVTLAAGEVPGQYLYAPLASPVWLTANKTYYLVSQETAGGDNWYDLEPIATAGVAAVLGPVYEDGHGQYVTVSGLPGTCYVPLSFLYQ